MVDDKSNSIKVFISHAKEETPLAMKLKASLTLRGFIAWSYEWDIPFGERIKEKIRNGISNCDHFLIILSKSAQKSAWVAMELGLALKLRKERGPRPSIIPLYARPADGALHAHHPASIHPRRFSDGAPLKSSHDFKSIRYFDLTRDEISSLIDQLRLKVSFVTSPDGEDGDLLTKSFDCYRALFPIKEERDSPKDIRIWLEEALAAELIGSPWREIYGVMHTGGLAIGMAFLTAHMGRHWCFGNYFGVRAAWRQSGRAKFFFEALKNRIQDMDPSYNGILFEIEPIDAKVLRRAAGAPTLRDLLDDSTVRENVRRLRRLGLYSFYAAEVFMNRGGMPLPYWQPAMALPLDETNEVPLILMAFLRKRDFQLEELLDFVYDDLYGDAYGGEGTVEIPGYREYCATVKRRVAAKATRGWQFAGMKLPSPWRTVLEKVRREGLDPVLEL